jgi:fibronectin type 3 domain-containing protein
MPPLTTTDGATLTNLAGYRIYYGTDVTQLTRRIEVHNPGVVTYVIEGLVPATYYFAVTAIDANGAESARSNAGRKVIS